MITSLLTWSVDLSFGKSPLPLSCRLSSLQMRNKLPAFLQFMQDRQIVPSPSLPSPFGRRTHPWTPYLNEENPPHSDKSSPKPRYFNICAKGFDYTKTPGDCLNISFGDSNPSEPSTPILQERWKSTGPPQLLYAIHTARWRAVSQPPFPPAWWWQALASPFWQTSSARIEQEPLYAGAEISS